MRPLFPKSSPLSSDFSFYASLETFSCPLNGIARSDFGHFGEITRERAAKGGRKREASQESRAKRNLFEDGQGRRCFIVIASWLVLGNVRRNLKKNSQSITSDRQSASRYKLLSATRHRRRRQITRRYLFPLLSALGLVPTKESRLCAESLNSMSPRHH